MLCQENVLSTGIKKFTCVIIFLQQKKNSLEVALISFSCLREKLKKEG
jgi:hypothetical protein